MIRVFISVSLALLAFENTTVYAARVKDIASIKGVRENLLIGYGIVVGLKGTGDSDSEITSKSMTRLFEKIGLQSGAANFKSKNVAAVIVTTKLPAFSRAGTRMDVNIASIGDASSLEGGTLLITPLRAGDQNVYAVAQGQISLGSTTDGGGKAFGTAARVPGGAIIEKEIDGSFTQKKSFVLSLNNPDFTTAARLAKTINTELSGKYAIARDSGTIDIIVPFSYEGTGVELLATVENLQVNPDSRAKVVLNERTGTVVIGENVRIEPVAISHGELTIEVSGPKGPKDRMMIMGGSNIKEIVKALNTLGAKPQDMTAIFQALRASGALQAELEIL